MQKVVPVFPVVISSPSGHGFSKSVFFTVDLERNTGITGVPFGRTVLSISASCRKFRAFASRKGPVGPGIEGISEKFDFHEFLKKFVYRFFMPDLECKNGITGVPIGRTELSNRAS